MSQWRTYVSVLGALLLTGCTAASAAANGVAANTAPGTTGHVTGKLVMEGGPMGPGGRQPGERPLPGTVTFTATFTGAGHRPVNVGVGTSGRFSAWLAPGRYHVTGRSPDVITVTGSGQHLEQTCSQPSSVTVRAEHTTTVVVACVVP